MQFNILQYLPENAKLLADIDLNDKLFGTERLIDLCNKFNISLKNLSRYRNRTRALPLSFFLAIVKYRKIKLNELQNKIIIKINNCGGYLKIGPILEINSNWVYISELLKGDGHITRNFWYINFTNKEDSLIQTIRDFFLSLGLSEKRIDIREREGIKFMTIRSYLLAYLFYRILGVTPGKKSKIIDINDFVTKDLEFGKAAVRGAFDAEGSVSFIASRRVSISSISFGWIKKLKLILEKLRIKSSIFEDRSRRENAIYVLVIYGIINIKRFYDEIKPVHQKRKEKLQEIINSYWKNPEYIFHKDILLSIKMGINRKKDIASKLKIKLITAANNISKLRNKGYITPKEKIFSNNGSFFKYQITKKGEEYLEKELIPFFD